MAFSLTWLPEVLENAGLKIAEQPGWRTRGRAEMGVVKGVMCHHTSTNADGNMPTLRVLTEGREDLAGPLAQLGLGRDGTYYIIAAGRCNHAGAGNWQGITTGNSSFIGIEGENRGVPRDYWPEVQLEAYRRGVAAILTKIGANSIMCCGHKEYALPIGRKDDPLFDMGEFRRDVAAIMAGTAPRPGVIPAVDGEGRPTLRRGDRGDLVKVIQHALALGDDGVFGPSTEAAVRQFQRQHNLVPDGIVGPRTWASLPAGAGRPQGVEIAGGPAAPRPSPALASLLAIGGHMLPEDPGPPAAPQTGATATAITQRSATMRAMARSLVGDVPRLVAAPEDDVAEFSSTAIGAPPVFARALQGEPAATAVVETMFSGIETADFDFPAFETFIRSLSLQHFTPLEFLFLGASNQAGPCAGRNSLPPRELWPNIANTAVMLDRIRALLGAPIHILSAYRNSAYNSCISGAGGSYHKRFTAIDWRCESGTVTQWREAARQLRASEARFRGGIGFYPNSSFIHIDTRGTNADW